MDRILDEEPMPPDLRVFLDLVGEAVREHLGPIHHARPTEEEEGENEES